MVAQLDRSIFYGTVRTPLFHGKLLPDQVTGMETILDACPPDTPRWWLAYCLATAFHETAATMLPIDEYGKGKGKGYGPGGWYGRGLVQLTWEANYIKATNRLRQLGYITATQSLVKDKELAKEPRIASAILFVGMAEGWFTDKKLSDYFHHSVCDPEGARRIINGVDCKALIAGYFRTFDKALIAAGYAPGATVAKIPTPPVKQAPLQPPKLAPVVPVPQKPVEPAPAPAKGFWRATLERLRAAYPPKG